MRPAANVEQVFALGIDPGLSRCGYGAVRGEGGRLEVVAFGHLETPTSDPVSTRLGLLLDDLQELIADLRPDVMVVERVLFQVNARTAMSVGQASGIALLTAASAGLPVVEYSANEVKLAVAGYGGATKDQVQRMVATLCGLHEVPRPPDVADALALALCHLAASRTARRIPATSGPVRPATTSR